LEIGIRNSGNENNSIEKILFLSTSYNEDMNKAVQSIRFWRGSMIKAFFDVDVHNPRKIEENGQIIGDDNYKICFLSYQVQRKL
jgi:hypothetical protein